MRVNDKALMIQKASKEGPTNFGNSKEGYSLLLTYGSDLDFTLDLTICDLKTALALTVFL